MADLLFENGFHGRYTVRGQELVIGYDEIQPYDMTYGAIASCLYSTFCEIAHESGVEIRRCSVHVSGTKRSTVPSTVSRLLIRFAPEADADPSFLEQAFQEALEKCSMVATFRCVAEIDAAIEFPVKEVS
jgi:uncharacterized OsmC-like protein